jgi:hypothetical protein
MDDKHTGTRAQQPGAPDNHAENEAKDPAGSPDSASTDHGAEKSALRKSLHDDLVGWVALAFSVLGLIGTNLWLGIQWDTQREQLAIQRENLARAQEQFELEGGSLKLDPYVDALDRETLTWTSWSTPEDLPFADTRLTYDNFDKSFIYVVITTTNIGRSDTSISGAGIVLDGLGGETTGDVYCESTPPDEPGLRPCEFPLAINAQTSVLLFIPIDPSSEGLACNDYVESQGLIAAVERIDGIVRREPTTTKVPFSNDCPGPAVAPPS